jgi:hypothetical protein
MKTVILLGDHNHEGVQYYAGQSLALEDADADWLVDAVLGQRVETAKAAEKLPDTVEYAAAQDIKAAKGSKSVLKSDGNN